MYSAMKCALVFLCFLLVLGCMQVNGQDVSTVKVRMPRINTVPNAKMPGSGVAPAIVGGTAAATGQFKWMAAIIQDSSYFCGGTILTNLYIMTAAHCAHGVTNFTVYLGTINWTNTTTRITYKTTTKIVHANYSASSLINDIALIKLASAISSTYFSTGRVALVRLPTQTQVNAGTTFNYLSATAVGWGKVNDTSSVSKTLNFVNGLTIINNTQCVSIFGSTTVKATTLCAYGGGTKNICSGDSGGPLLITEAGNYTQVGVTSFGASSTCYNYPSGFSRVTSYIPWLKSKIGTSLVIRP